MDILPRTPIEDRIIAHLEHRVTQAQYDARKAEIELEAAQCALSAVRTIVSDFNKRK